MLCVFYALENSEGINDIFDHYSWKEIKVAQELKIIGITPVESKLTLKTSKISAAQIGRYQQSCTIPIEFKFPVIESRLPISLQSEADSSAILDCGFRTIDELQTILGNYPKDRDGRRHLV